MIDEQAVVAYINRLQAELDVANAVAADAARQESEPIAIIGAACHFPGGGDGLEGLWHVVADGVDACRPAPVERGWGDDARFVGGFTDDAARFDAGFFGISEGEARIMGPQQRRFLETCWEALEDARLPPASLKGTATSVFAGAVHDGYGLGGDQSSPEVAAYGLTGTFMSVVSGRVAYLLGLEGPAVSIDTACSSSLVALHLACQSLRRGESTLALAGGVTVLVGPEIFKLFDGMGGVAPDGRCKAFADQADGTSWGEGAGVVVLERLSQAQRLGHHVRAVVRGSAVNQDGASNGLSAPNGPAQQRVIRQALANARVSADQVDAVEAHGTGTVLGDPIEAQALIATYGLGHSPARPLWLGSVKSNFGHTAAAAGVAGLLKMVAAFEHETLPPTLWVDRPTSHVDWSAGSVALLREAQPWPRGQRPRLAGISSFGVSGTNAHVIIEEAPAELPAEAVPVDRVPPARAGLAGPKAGFWPVSGHGQAGLSGQAGRLAAWLRAAPELDVTDLGWSLATTRDQLAERAVVVGPDRAALLAGLDALAAGHRLAPAGADCEVAAGPVGAGLDGRSPKVAFVFPGQGAQWVGMGRGLLKASAVFAEVAGISDRVVRQEAGWSLLDVLRGSAGAPSPDRLDVVQPVLFAVMVGLAELWRSCGVAPQAVVGHSQGEVAAAVVAGALTLEEGCRIVVRRSRTLAPLEGLGTMASVACSAAAVRDLLAPWQGAVDLAAVNGPAAVVISGDRAAVLEVVAECERRELRASQIHVEYASHCAHIDGLRAPILEALGDAAGRSSAIPFYSTVTAGRFDTTRLDADYWYRNLRQPVLFDPTTAQLAADGYNLFVEISPHPVLAASLEHGLAQAGAAAMVVPTLKRDRDEPASFLAGLAQVHLSGGAIDWRGLYGDGRAAVDLPTYAFQQRDYWVARPALDGAQDPTGAAASRHAFLTGGVSLADSDALVLSGRVSLDRQPWLADHSVGGAVIFPAAAVVDLAWEAAERVGANRVEELVLREPLLLTDDAVVDVQVIVDVEGAISLYARPAAEAADSGSGGAEGAGEPGEPVGRDGSGDPTGRDQSGGPEGADAGDRHDGRDGLDGPEALDGLDEDEGSDGGGERSWTCHATGRVARGRVQPSAAIGPATPPEGAPAVELDGFYEALADHDFVFGPAFRGLRRAWRGDDAWFGEVEAPAPGPGFRFPPALLDACLQLSVVAGAAGGATTPVLPFAFTGLDLFRRPAGRLHVGLRPAGPGVSVWIDDETGPVAQIGQVVTRPVDVASLNRRRAGDDLYEVAWVAADVPAAPRQAGRWTAWGSPDRAATAAGELTGPSPDGAVAAGGESVAVPSPVGLELASGPSPVGQAAGGGESVAMPSPVGLELSSGPSPDGAVAAGGESVAVSSPVGLELSSGPSPVGQAAGGGESVPVPSPRADGAAPGPDSAAGPVVTAQTDLAAFLAELDAVGGAPDIVLLLPTAPQDDPPFPELARWQARRALAWLQRWLGDPRLARTRLAVVTTGAVAALPGESPAHPDQAAVWGLVRSAQTEQPGRFDVIDVDVDPDAPATWAELAGLVTGPHEDQLAWRAGRVLVPRLVPAVAEEAPAVGFDPAGTVVITGGLGTLGRLLARHLATHHHLARLVLLGRQGPAAPDAEALRAELAGLGTEVAIEACDVTDREQLAAVLAEIPADRPLTGLVHAAGVLRDHVIPDLTDDDLDEVVAVKVAPAWHLHELTWDQPGVVTVYYSSAAALAGAHAQGNYAAANAVLDALAGYRAARGRPTTSVGWGFWRDRSALTARVDDVGLARLGLRPLAASHGLALFDQALGLATPAPLAASLDRRALRAVGAALPPLWRLVAPPAAGAIVVGPELAALAELPADERRRRVVALVEEHTAAVLPGVTLDSAKTFKDLGLMSLGAVELRNRLNALTGLKLPVTAVFDYPTPAALADYLVAELTPLWEAGGRPARARRARPARTAQPARAQRVSSGGAEPVAVIGVACRFPGGVDSLAGMWRLVANRTDGVGPLPAGRSWPTEARRDGGWLPGAASFDAGFFGIGEGEASVMDPQQRLFLEVCWEALEDARLRPGDLRGTDVGVFAGMMPQAYGIGSDQASAAMVTYGATGLEPSVLTGRVSYVLGLTGPAVTIDTACSSSLVALHLACQSLRSGESPLALVGGVQVLTGPETFAAFDELGGMAPDARCKAFGEEADGTSWSEGVGVIVVERLSEALRLGHRVRAVVRGSAVNQDGATNGLTAPNGPSQQRVIRQALANAGLRPDEIDAVEAHGTGTALGDPIEAQALLATYGRDRPADRPLWLGTVKSNIGHAGAAAGVAGLIKMVAALERETLPATLWVERPTTRVDWDGSVALLAEPRPWPRGRRPRRVGISSFGVSGTNAHVIVEEAPALNPVASVAPAARPAGGSAAGSPRVDAPPAASPGADDPGWWLITGHGEAGLSAQAARLAAWLRERPELDPRDVGWSLATTREPLPDRAAVIAPDRAGLAAGLDHVAAGGRLAPDGAGYRLVTGRAGPTPRPVFVFPGQGAQRPGMGRDLLVWPAFRSVIARCHRVIAELAGWSLLDVVGEADGAASLERVDVVQPALFAVMVGLAELWRACGVEPGAVVGHSQGELAAAVVAGALTVEEGCRIVVGRSSALRPLEGAGAMASLGLPADRAQEFVAGWYGAVGLAAVNGPDDVIVSGPRQAVADVVAAARVEGWRAAVLPVSYASHSPQIDDVRPALLEAVGTSRGAVATTPFYSTLTGDRADTTALDGDYWFENLRRPVQFAPTVRRLLDDGFDLFVEVSPHPVLALPLTQAVEESGAGVVSSLRRDHDERLDFLTGLAGAAVRGLPVGWPAVLGEAVAVDLPAYSFQHKDYWLESSLRDRSAPAGLEANDHPVAVGRLGLAGGGTLVLTGRLSLAEQPWLADHVVAGTVVLPASVWIDLAFEAAGRTGRNRIDELVLHQPLVLAADGAVVVQVEAGADGAIAIHSRALADGSDAGDRADGPDGRDRAASSSRGAGSSVANDDVGDRADVRDGQGPGSDRWICHATGQLGGERAAADWAAPPVWPPAGATPVDLTGFYDRLAEHDFVYGPAFRGLRRAWRGEGEVFADIELPDDDERFRFPPPLFDASLHAAVAALGDDGAGGGELRLAFSFSGAELYRRASGGRLRAVLSPAPDGSFRLRLTEPDGRPLARVDRVVSRPVDTAALRRQAGASDLYRLTWVPAEPAPAGAVGAPSVGQPWAVITRGDPEASGWAAGLGRETMAVAVYDGREAFLAALAAGASVPERLVVVVEGAGEPPAGPGETASQTVVDLVSGGGVSGPERAAGETAVDLTSGDGRSDPGPTVGETGLDLAPRGRESGPGRAVGEAGPTDRACRIGRDGLGWLKTLLADSRLGETELVFVTRGAVAAAPDDRVTDVAQAALWGLVRSAQLEHPGRFALVDVADLVSDAAPLATWLAAPAENQAALRRGRPWVPRVARLADPAADAVAIDPAGTALVTGGTGALGSLLARHLAETHQVARLVLLSRRGPAAPGAAELADELESLGVEVAIEACDVADRAQLAAVVAAIPPDRPLAAVFHAAGVVADGLIGDLTDEAVDAVIRAKLAPACHLHELTRDAGPVPTLYYSSVAGTLGAAGVANYAAANAALDALAVWRDQAGRPTRAVAWGLWGEARGGFTAVRDAADPARGNLARSGLRPMTTAHGLALLDAAWAQAAPALLATPLDLAALRAAGLADLMPVWRLLAPSEKDLRPARLAGDLAGLPDEERLDHVLALVVEHTAAVIPGSAPQADVTFKDLGLQSLGAVELRNRLNLVTGLKLPATLVFDHPTPGAVAAHILAELAPPAAPPVPSEPPELARVRDLLDDPHLPEADKQVFRDALEELCAAFLEEVA